MRIKTCLQCGSEFRKKGNMKFCSKKCEGESRRIYRICHICGTSFHGAMDRKTCSKKCQYESFKGAGNPMFEDKAKKSNCMVCGNLFKYSPTNRSGKYCSKVCAYTSPEWRAKQAAVKIKSTNGIRDKVHKSRIRAGKQYNDWRLSIFKRDNYKCVMCSGKESIQVHHVIPFSVLFKEIKISGFVDFSPLYDIENGVTLCQPCHLLTDSYGTLPIELKVIRLMEKIFTLEPEGHNTFGSYYTYKTELYIEHLKSKLNP